MMKKILLSIALFTIIVSLASCGSGPGSSSEPGGVNPGIPSVVQLLDVQNIVQTNSSVYFKAKILDGNGNPVRDEPVTFINLSSIGTWQSPVTNTDISLSSVTTMSSTVRYTDSLGFATIRLFSPVSGFATVQAEVNTGAGQVRDQRTVFFTTSNTLVLWPTLALDVDGDGDGIFNETVPPGNNDFLLFENAADNQVIVRATVLSGIGQPIFGSTVTFGADAPYRVGDPDAACSDGSDTCEVFFPNGNIKTTNSNGQASVLVQVTPTFLRTITTTLNITAVADFDTFTVFNMVTLFLNPVTVATVTVSANPTTVESGGSSTITAFVLTSAGTPVPDGTSVNFTATAGGIEPFAQTTDGIAEVKFTAPELADGASDLVVTITATVAGVSGTTTVTVTTDPLALAVNPPSQSISGVTGGTRTYTITGGTPPYSVFSSDSANAYDSAAGDGIWSVATSGGTFVVTVPALAPAGTVTLTVQDTVGDTVTATLIITGPAALVVAPTSATMSCSATSPNGPTFNVSGGIVGAGYSILSLNPTIIAVSTATVLTDPGTFRTDATAGACAAIGAGNSATVDVTVTDTNSPASVVTVTLTVTNP